MPPDDLLRRLYAALVRKDEDRDTFNDTFLYLYSHPCPFEEYGRRFVTRFYFLRKERWQRQTKEFSVGTLPDIPQSDVSPDTAPDALSDTSVPCAALRGSALKANNTTPVYNETSFLNSLKHAISQETHKKRQSRHSRKK